MVDEFHYDEASGYFIYIKKYAQNRKWEESIASHNFLD